MRKVLVAVTVLAVIMLVLVSGCVGEKNTRVKEITIGGKTIIEEDLVSAPDFDLGLYYAYYPPEFLETLKQQQSDQIGYRMPPPAPPSVKDFNVNLIFSEMIRNNVPLEEAWYKVGMSSCCRGELCSPAIVTPALILKLREKNDYAEEHLLSIKEPDLGWCAYRVLHYIFKQ